MSDTLTTLLAMVTDAAENPEATGFDDGLQLAAIALLGWLEDPDDTASRDDLIRIIEQDLESAKS